MFKNIQSFLTKYSSGRNILILFIVTQIIYAFMLIVTIPSVMEHSNEMKLLDMQPMGYSVEYAQQLLESLGEEGRNKYLFTQIPVDMVYPSFFAIAYSLMLAYFFRKIFRNPDKVYFLCIIPVLGGLFDYLENLGVIVMITAYPKFNPAIARGMNVFSISKSLFTTLFFALLAVLAITLAVKRLQNFSKTRS